jgi:hypothetical protein
VVFDKQGNLYVATTDGGPPSCAPIGGACGTVYELSPPAKEGDPWTATLIRMFEGKKSNDASVPTGGLILDGAGNLYGVTGYGGTGDCVLVGVPAGCGTVYELSPPAQKGGAWTETILYSFPSSKQGYLPNGGLIFDSEGNLYGATMFGGGQGTACDPFYQYCGAVFKLSPPKTKGGKWAEHVLHSFAGGTDGANPKGSLVLDNKGAIYGTTAGVEEQVARAQDAGRFSSLSRPQRKAARGQRRYYTASPAATTEKSRTVASSSTPRVHFMAPRSTEGRASLVQCSSCRHRTDRADYGRRLFSMSSALAIRPSRANPTLA